MKAAGFCVNFCSFVLLYFATLNVWSGADPEKTMLSPLVIESAWSPAAPPMVPVRAGYFTFTNQSQVPIKIVGAQSPAFERVEIHKSVITDSVASMSAVNSITVNPGETLEAKPGGLHLMLVGAKATAAKTIPVMLLLEQGGSVFMELEVETQTIRQNSHSSQAQIGNITQMHHDKHSEHVPHRHH